MAIPAFTPLVEHVQVVYNDQRNPCFQEEGESREKNGSMLMRMAPTGKGDEDCTK